MSSVPPAMVADVVARFFESRRQGQHLSIDEVLERFPDVVDRERTRVEALQEISRRARTVKLPPGSSDEVGDLSIDAAPQGPLPELDEYDIVDVLGHGGMGVVYEAYQRSTGRRVAIKFMLAARTRAEAARRRFEREVELVARLEHPNIVAVIDSGIDRDRYYYVMEYVDGRSLQEAFTPGECDPHTVLGLIADVADTVDYAHQRGVLHRDLKPSNVMIDERGRPRLLDFGLAKAFDPDSAEGLDLTLSEPGQLVGTLAYMSPEQSRGQFQQMSVRSDVYSLGAMAYELLTGELPCGVDGALGDVLNRIAEQDPRRPALLRHELSADVDAILLKSLEKSPQARYPTAGELAADLRRHLADEPILARRSGPATRVARWVRHHRGIASVAMISLVLMITVATAALLQIAAERERTDVRGERAQGMSSVMLELLATGDPDLAAGADASLRQEFAAISADWEQRLGEFGDEPRMEAELRVLFGRMCMLHGEYQLAEQSFRRAQKLLREDVPQAAPLELARASTGLARALHKLTRYAEAEQFYREALTIQEGQYGPVHAQVAQTLCNLAWAIRDQDRLDEAETLYRQALETFDALPEDQRDKAQIAAATNNLGLLLSKQGRNTEAEPLLRGTLALRRELHESPHQDVATSMANLGTCLRQLGRFEESELLLREALALRATLFGQAHPTTVVSMNLLGLLLRDRGKYAEAEAVLRAAHDLRTQALGPEPHEFIAISKHNLAVVLIALREYAEAEQLLLDAIEISRAVFPDFEQHRAAAFDWHALANLDRAQGDYAQAREFCTRALEVRRTCYSNPNHQEIGASLFLMGRISLEAGDPQAAEPLLTEALAILGRLPEGHWRTALCQSVLGADLTNQGRYAEAEELLVEGFEALRQRADLPNCDTLDALDRVIDLYQAWDRPEQAEEFRALLPVSDEVE